jgi:hypothetical protein
MAGRRRSSPAPAGSGSNAPSPAGGESRYRPRRPARPATTGTAGRQVMRPRLTDPDTVAMTDAQHEQAVAALAAMIVAWLQRHAPDRAPDPEPAVASDPPTRPHGRDRRTS